MNKFRKSLALLALKLVSGLGFILMVTTAQAAAPSHLLWAENIAMNVMPENNVYGSSPSYIYWAGVNGATTYTNRTECSSFLTRVLAQAYSWNNTVFLNWMGSKSPNAATYHDTILSQNRFSLIQKVADIQAGDIIAVKYPAGLPSTGHVMIASRPAVSRTASAPLVSNTVQYEIEIIDSSQSGHGANDTRLLKNSTWDDGAGVGKLRLYADTDGNITGYSWSTYSNSQYYDQNIRNLVVGRLQ